MNLVRLSRALAFGAPLAFLCASFVSPPDPFSQLLYMAVGILLFVPAAYVSIAESGNARTLAVFFGAILVTVLVGGFAVNAANGGTLGRFLVLAGAVVAGTFAAGRFG